MDSQSRVNSVCWVFGIRGRSMQGNQSRESLRLWRGPRASSALHLQSREGWVFLTLGAMRGPSFLLISFRYGTRMVRGDLKGLAGPGRP